MAMEGYWDVVASSLQDICNNNEKQSFDPISDIDSILASNSPTTNSSELKRQLQDFKLHRHNLDKSNRLLDTILINVNGLISQLDERASEIEQEEKRRLEEGKAGRSYYTSHYNPSDPIIKGSDVAFKPRGRDAEWIQCEVVRVISETKFEVRDPEPDENNPNGQMFKATWKDVILIPPGAILNKVNNYPAGTRVLARYPETTTFYPAEVVGFKRDGTCRLKFEGEEEINKETEVERRLVVPYPE